MSIVRFVEAGLVTLLFSASQRYDLPKYSLVRTGMSMEFSAINTFSVDDTTPLRSFGISDLTRNDESTMSPIADFESSVDSVYHVNRGKGRPTIKEKKKQSLLVHLRMI